MMRNMFSSQISSVPEEGLDQLTVPKSVQARLPPGISLSHTGSGGSSSSNKRPAASGSASFTMTPAQEEPPPKRVALPDNVAGALASIFSSPASASKKKVELELSDAQINHQRPQGAGHVITYNGIPIEQQGDPSLNSFLFHCQLPELRDDHN